MMEKFIQFEDKRCFPNFPKNQSLYLLNSKKNLSEDESKYLKLLKKSYDCWEKDFKKYKEDISFRRKRLFKLYNTGLQKKDSFNKWDELDAEMLYICPKDYKAIWDIEKCSVGIIKDE